jgi:PPM family protein phosphatase
MLRPSEARAFPHRNVIMKALGLKEQAELEFFRRRARRGDIYLLCSDGLTDMVEDEDIEEILCYGGPIEEMCTKLVEAAMDAGGHDNITVLLAQYGGAKAGEITADYEAPKPL